MIKVLFVCHGNICRSQMGEAMMKHMVRKRDIADAFYIDSAGVSYEAAGWTMYRPAVMKLKEYGVPSGNHISRRIEQEDYGNFDYILCMDTSNVNRCRTICGGDPDHKIHRLLEYTGKESDIADPWYTRDFETSYRQINEGIEGFLDYLGY